MPRPLFGWPNIKVLDLCSIFGAAPLPTVGSWRCSHTSRRAIQLGHGAARTNDSPPVAGAYLFRVDDLVKRELLVAWDVLCTLVEEVGRVGIPLEWSPVVSGGSAAEKTELTLLSLCGSAIGPVTYAGCHCLVSAAILPCFPVLLCGWTDVEKNYNGCSFIRSQPCKAPTSTRSALFRTSRRWSRRIRAGHRASWEAGVAAETSPVVLPLLPPPRVKPAADAGAI